MLVFLQDSQPKRLPCNTHRDTSVHQHPAYRFCTRPFARRTRKANQSFMQPLLYMTGNSQKKQQLSQLLAREQHKGLLARHALQAHTLSQP